MDFRSPYPARHLDPWAGVWGSPQTQLRRAVWRCSAPFRSLLAMLTFAHTSSPSLRSAPQTATPPGGNDHLKPRPSRRGAEVGWVRRRAKANPVTPGLQYDQAWPVCFLTAPSRSVKVVTVHSSTLLSVPLDLGAGKALPRCSHLPSKVDMFLWVKLNSHCNPPLKPAP